MAVNNSRTNLIFGENNRWSEWLTAFPEAVPVGVIIISFEAGFREWTHVNPLPAFPANPGLAFPVKPPPEFPEKPVVAFPDARLPTFKLTPPVAGAMDAAAAALALK